MPKTVPAPVATHLGLETTSLASLWEITRKDGTKLFLTDHDSDITFAGDVYESSIGYDRTGISNRVGLNVDNLDVTGFLDSSALTEAELRGGLYDRAEVKISLIIWNSPSDGVIRMRKGEFGEVSYTNEGGFKTELRGLTQPFSQQLVETYQPICRADLGDTRCKIELFPDVVLRNTAYAVGDVVRASPALEGIIVPTLLLPLDTDEDDISPNAFTGTLTGSAAIVTTQSQFGGGSVEFVNAAGQGLDFTDDPAFELGTNDFTMDFWFRADTISASFWGPVSQYNNVGNQRVFWVGINNANLFFFISDDGTSATPAFSIRPDFTFAADTWYHIAITKDTNNVLRVYVDGTQISGTRTTLSVAGGNQFTRASGSFIDDGFETVGSTITTSGFTDPANNGTFTISAIAAGAITVSGGGLVNESGTGDESIEANIPFAVFNGNQPFRLGRVDSTTDVLFDGWIDDFRLINGVAAWTGTSFTVPASAHTPGITPDLLDSLVTSDFDDRIYTCTVAGTTDGAQQPAYDTTVGNSTVDGTCTFVAGQAFTRAGIVSGVLDNRNFSMTFPNVADTREVAADWFKYGAVKWNTGNNTPNGFGLAMDVKASTLPVTTGTTTLSVSDSNTFTRPAGSFLTDGFQVGQAINTTGFTNGANNGTFIISAVTATTMDIEETTLVMETGDADEVMTGDEFIELFQPMPFDIEVGDTFSIYAGCDKTLTQCSVKFDNVTNRRAEDYLPSRDKLIKINRTN
jgi:hypothetical protein